MIELSLLGLHALRGLDGREVGSLPAQPKRFALLAYLAIAGGGGYHRRDTLAAMFWPDLDQFAARRALRNTLYHLRDALGDGVIIAQGDDALSIDPAALTCDVTRLGAAVQEGRYQAAVDYYRGELLAGIHFANAGEAFEEWLSHERLRIIQLVMRAISALVDQEERAGNIRAAAHWAERACALAPDDESWLRRGMSLLDTCSDTGDALRMYETYAHRLAAEFDATPSGETAAMARRIREGIRERSAPTAAAVEARPEPAADRLTHVPRPDPAPAWREPRGRRITVWAAGVGAVALLALLVARTIGSPHPGTVAARPRVLITVFDNHTGDAGLQSLGRMTQDWLAQGLVRTHLVEVVDPRAVFVQSRADSGAAAAPSAIAQRTGASLLVSGGYYRAGDTLFFQAVLRDAQSQRILRAVGPIRSRVQTPVAGLDELRSRVMSALASVVDAHATQGLGGGEPPPFGAYRDYVDGWDAYWHGDIQGARTLFLRSAHADSSFTAAGLALATVGANSNDCPLVDSLARALETRSIDHLARLSLRIADARCHGRNDEMLRLTLERADLDPGNPSEQMSAAAAALWANRPAQALELLSRVDPAVDLGWSTDTTQFAYWGGLAEALHLLGRHREEKAAADHLPAGAPLGRLWLEANALAGWSKPTAALAVLDRAMALPIETASDIGLAPYTDGRPEYTMTPAWVANWVARELAFHGDTVAARQAAMRAVAWYRSRPAAERATPEERLVAAWSLEMTGARPEAERIARQLATEDSGNVDFRGELAGLAAERGDTALADSLDRWLAAQPVSRVGWSAIIYRARVAALLGRPDAALARLRDAFDAGIWPRWLHQEPSLAGLRDRPDFSALARPRG